MGKNKKNSIKILKIYLLIFFLLGLSGCDLKDECLDSGGGWLQGVEACEKYAINKKNALNIDRLMLEEKNFYSEYPSSEYLLEELTPYGVLAQHLTLLIEESRNDFIKKYRSFDFNRPDKLKIQQHFYVESLVQNFRYKQVLLKEEIFYKESQKQRILENINYDIQHFQILNLSNFFVTPEITTQKIKIFLENFINTQQEIRNPNPKFELKKFRIKNLKDYGIYWTLKSYNSVETLVFHVPKNPLGTELLEVEIPLEIFLENLKKSYKSWFVKTQDKFEVMSRY